MTYAGRFVLASPLELTKNVWWNCELQEKQRTNEVSQLHGRDTREVENCDPDALPESQDARERIKGANKYFEVGPAACHEIWTSLLEGSNQESIGPATLLIDVHLGTRDMLSAFCNARANFQTLFYMGFAEDQNQAIYVETVLKEFLAE